MIIYALISNMFFTYVISFFNSLIQQTFFCECDADVYAAYSLWKLCHVVQALVFILLVSCTDAKLSFCGKSTLWSGFPFKYSSRWGCFGCVGYFLADKLSRGAGRMCVFQQLFWVYTSVSSMGSTCQSPSEQMSLGLKALLLCCFWNWKKKKKESLIIWM